MVPFLIVLLIVNSICAAAYAVVKALHGEESGIFIFFLFLPALGFAVYFLPLVLGRLSGKKEYGRDHLVRRNKIERLAEHPDIEEELSIVPVEDAMAINEDKEKRALILRQLKKDNRENYKALLPAENDTDSESVHYVAATKMEIYRSLHQRWQERRLAYEEDPADVRRWREVCDAIRTLIDSQVLSDREREMYKKKYCGLIETQSRRDAGMLSARDYETYLSYLIDLKQFEAAEQFWNQKRDSVKSEDSYMRMLEMFYRKREKGKFRECIAQLRKDRQIRLSAEGLDRLRYWIQRE